MFVMNELLTNKKHEKKYWEKYYTLHNIPVAPSLFAQFISTYIKKQGVLLELGCGNGRDSIYFADRHKLQVIAVDQCENEIRFLKEYVNKTNLTFMQHDFTNLAKNEFHEKLDYIYSRFSLHAISEQDRDSTIQWVHRNLKNDGLFMIEARGLRDTYYGIGKKVEHEKHAFITDHYRCFIDFMEFQDMLKEIGFKIIYAEERAGFAPFNGEDPIAIRIIVQK